MKTTAATAPLANSAGYFRELADAAEYYLDMLYACDSAMVDGIFHPQAQLCTFESGKLIFRSVEDYKDVLRLRTSPKSQGAAREDELITIDIATATQSLIKIKARVNDMVFVDYLTLIRLDQGWRIVSKTYQRLDAKE